MRPQHAPRPDRGRARTWLATPLRLNRGPAALIGVAVLAAVGLLVYVLIIQQLDFTQRRADRDKLDAAQSHRISQLACVFASQINEDKPGYPPAQRRKIKEYRAVYGCPPYSPERARDPFGPLTATAPTTPAAAPARGAESHSPVTATQPPAPGRSSSASAATRPPSSRSVRPSTATTTAVATRTRTVTSTAPRPPILPTPCLTVTVVHVCA